MLTKLAWKLADIVFRTHQRHREGRDHGLHCTLFEEIFRALYFGKIGAQLWRLMKTSTENAFREHAVGDTMLRYIDGSRKNGALKPITLVGHSAGSIFICWLLRHAREHYPELKFDVIFLAPACTMRLFCDTLDLALPSLRSFRCFAMSDELEQADCSVRTIYPRSLLYLVSGLLEDEPDTPILGMQRFYKETKTFPNMRFAQIARMRQLFADDPKRAVWSEQDDGVGTRCGARSHGGFDADVPTLESVKHILQKGF
jgi:hypothetical protein